MAYKHKHDHRYQLVNITSSYSKTKRSKGHPLKTLTFKNLDLNKNVETYVVVSGLHQDGVTYVDGFANEKHWSPLIDYFDTAKDLIFYFSPYMVDHFGNTSNFKVKLKKEKTGVKYILNADSEPQSAGKLVSSFKPVAKPVQVMSVKQFDSPLFDIKG